MSQGVNSTSKIFQDIMANWPVGENGKEACNQIFEAIAIHLSLREHPANIGDAPASEICKSLNSFVQIVENIALQNDGVVADLGPNEIDVVLGVMGEKKLSLLDGTRIATKIIEKLRAKSNEMLENSHFSYGVAAGISKGHVTCGFLETAMGKQLRAYGEPLKQARTFSEFARSWQISVAPGEMSNIVENMNGSLPSTRPVLVESDNTTTGINEQDYLDIALSQTEDEFNFVALERVSEDQWRTLLPFPDWFAEIIGDKGNDGSTKELVSLIGIFDFLDNFLIDAEGFWDTEARGSLRSGTWEELGPADEHIRMEASAVFFGDRKVLMMEKAGSRIKEKINVLQRFRERELEYSKLVSELERRELVLHCIVHDLSSPLAGVQAALSLLNSESLSEEGREFLDLCMKQSNRVSVQIREILDAFSAEVQDFDPALVTASTAPNIVEAANDVVAGLKPLALLHKVDILTNYQDLNPDSRLVVADKANLIRVFYNLIENAIWHSPSESQITVNIQSRNESIHVDVRDEGPGVHESLVSTLFRKFTRLKGKVGKIGLGLYFCRTTIEQWDGEIGYTRISDSGASFWFRLNSFSE